MSAVAFFAMGEPTQFSRLTSLIARVTRRGVQTYVFTDRRFADAVGRAGATFVDLFADRPVEATDGESIPLPCRYVSFAGAHVRPVAAELEALGVDLVVYDVFAVVGRAAAAVLGLPHVAVTGAASATPVEAAIPPSRRIADSCRHAVEVLRDRCGIEDASPFSYLTARSPHLNVHCEPASFVSEEERRLLEPVAFYGSLPDLADAPAPIPGRRRVYASLGTIVWRYWADVAGAGLRAVAAADPDAIISTGNADLDGGFRRWVDQWAVLRDDAGVFITHHGLKSTHEAILHGVPMISYPFFADQPRIARQCQERGLAVPLAAPREPVSVDDVRAALRVVDERRPEMEVALAAAREDDLGVVAGRDDVVTRVLALADGAPSPPG